MHENIAAESAVQRKSKIRWLWAPTLTLLVMCLVLQAYGSRWVGPVLLLCSLWVVLGSIGFTVMEGVHVWQTDWLGNGPDLRAVGVFSMYRKPTTPALILAVYGAAAAAGLALPSRLSDPVDGAFAFAALQYALSLAPLELATWQLARRWGDWPPLRARLALWLPAALLGLLANGAAVAVMEALHPDVIFTANWWAGPGLVAMYLLLISGAHHQATLWQDRVQQADRRANEADTARRLAEAQLAVLQAQIEPHFLYNTLATVQYLIKGEPAVADYLLTQLIRYLRLAMPSMRQYSSTLAREFELTDAYLQIARLRMGGRLDVDLDLSTELAEQEFPTLLLQTLAENAIKHGVEPKTGPVRIQVYARREGQRLEVGVRDSGVGLGQAPTSGGGTGLQNIRERLAQIYGDRARLSVCSLAQGGVLATVTLELQP